MDEFINWLESHLTVITSLFIPAAGIIIRPLFDRNRDTREAQLIRKHSELRKKLPQNSEAEKILDELLKSEAEQLKRSVLSKMGREVDPYAVIAIILISLFGFGISWLLLWMSQISQSISIISWLFCILFWIWTIFMAFFLLVGGAQHIYKETRNQGNRRNQGIQEGNN